MTPNVETRKNEGTTMIPNPAARILAELPPTELEQLHNDDLQAARAVVGIMLGVFTLGLLLYTFICWQVM
ncbi:MAG: hypothetical protein HY289_07975 [Planctomycetes bacterium]|nr:hypothetical protein [Planctomycetota bacterium]